MSASTPDIRAAIRARLETLLDTADPPGPFAQVKNWAGELRKDRTHNPGLDALGITPAVLVALGRETPRMTDRMTSGEVSQQLAQEWVLFVVVENGQDPDAIVETLDVCHDAVIACVIGSQVEGAEMPIELVSAALWWTAPGSYCHAITVRVTRSVGRAPGEEEGSAPLEELRADVNHVDTDETADASQRPAAIAHADDLQD